MGLFREIGNGLTGLFGEGFADRAARAGALVNGDYSQAAAIGDRMREAKAAREMQQGLVQSLRHKGMSDDDIQIILANPGKFAEDFSSRFGTRSVDEGSSVLTPNLDGSQNVFTAPKTFKEGADIMQTPIGNRMIPPAQLPQLSPAMARQFSAGDGDHLPGNSHENANPNFDVSRSGGQTFKGLRTEAEQYADSLADRGTKEWGSAVKDYAMKGYGPSAQGMLSQRLEMQRDIAEGRNATARYRVDHAAPHTSRAPLPKLPTPNRSAAARIRVRSIEEARRLPPGTRFIAPDGSLKER